MTFHTILHKSEQYIEALRRARQLTDDLSETINKNITDPDKQVSQSLYHSPHSLLDETWFRITFKMLTMFASLPA